MINQQFQDKGKDMWKFYVFSIIGIILFFIPIQIGKDNTILVDHIHLGIRSLLGDLTAYYALIIIIIGAILPVIRMDFKKSFTGTYTNCGSSVLDRGNTTESLIDRIWKGPLEIIKSNPPVKARSP